MKSEDRHKLQQNDLADSLVKFAEQVKPYQNAILGGIILVLVLILLMNWWSGRNASEMEVANTQFYEAMTNSLSTNDPVELREMAEKYPNSPAATVAAIASADIYLNNGCNLLYSNKTKAKKELENATNIYKKLLPIVSDNSFLLTQAKFGLARAEDCLNNLPEARKLYEEVVKSQPKGPYGTLAANRLADLDRPEIVQNYNKLANHEPPVLKDNSGLPFKSPSELGFPAEPSLINSDTFGNKFNLNSGSKDGVKPNDFLKDILPAPADEPIDNTKKPDETKAPDAAKPSPEPAKPADAGQPAADEKPATPPAESGK